MQSDPGYDDFSLDRARSCPTIYLTFENKYSAVGSDVSSTLGGNEVALMYF